MRAAGRSCPSNKTEAAGQPEAGVPVRCASLFFAMLTNPGAYNLTVVTDAGTVEQPFGPPQTATTFTNCRLDRVPRGDH